MTQPKYATLAEFVTAVQGGLEPVDGITVFVDNDAVCASRPDPEDDDDVIYLWNEDFGPERTCIALFKALGIHAERV